MKRLLTLFLLLLSLSSSGQQEGFNSWESLDHLGQKFISLNSLIKFYPRYQFSQRISGSSIYLESKNKKVVVRLINGSQEAFMNKVKFHFSYPVIRKSSKYWLSRVDLVKLVDPVLRPSQIKDTQGFKTVVLDPGHGGKDSGTSNRYGKEKNYTLLLAFKLKRYLQSHGFNVVMTRSTDKFLTLRERVDFANRYKNAIFISLHFNAGGRGRAAGIETFALSPTGVAHYGRGLRASDFMPTRGNVQDSANIALATALHGRVISKTKRRDRGIRRARFGVLVGIEHPAILFEGGFMSHPKEAKLINNETYLNLLAKTMSESVILYKNATEKNRLRR